MIILGVVGQIASGKGALVNYLTSHCGFRSFSLSSIIHDELRKKDIKKFDRKMLQDIGDELRKKEGDEILAKLALKQISVIGDPPSLSASARQSQMKLVVGNQLNQLNQKNKIIIDGIRNPGEIEFLKKNPNFVLIGVKAKRELRFKRLLSRGKKWDPKNYEEFLKVDKRDLGLKEGKSGQQVGKCLAYCDYVLTNNKDVVNFQRKVEKLMTNIK
jgi:dephospho-CoA kinase